MATGDLRWFAQGLLDLGNKIHNLGSDDIRVGIVTAATVPSTTTAAPHWGGTGTTNFASNQVATGTAYTGPITLTNKTWTIVSGAPTLRADVVNVAQDASGFTNGAYAIFYNNTDANKRALAFLEISAAAAASLVSGPLQIDWNGAANDILRLTPA